MVIRASALPKVAKTATSRTSTRGRLVPCSAMAFRLFVHDESSSRTALVSACVRWCGVAPMPPNATAGVQRKDHGQHVLWRPVDAGCPVSSAHSPLRSHRISQSERRINLAAAPWIALIQLASTPRAPRQRRGSTATCRVGTWRRSQAWPVVAVAAVR